MYMMLTSAFFLVKKVARTPFRRILAEIKTLLHYAFCLEKRFQNAVLAEKSTGADR